MKKLLLLGMIGVSVIAGAQSDPVKATIPSTAFLLKDEPPGTVFRGRSTARFRQGSAPEQWRTLRRTGIILTSVGIAAITTGFWVATSQEPANGNDYITANSPEGIKITAGMIGAACGVIALGGGITTWAIGSHRLKKYSRRMSFDIGSRSATLAYKF